MPGLENIRRTLNIVDEQADRISGLVHKLLDVTRIQTGKLELLRTSLDIHALVAKMVEKAQHAAPSQCFELEPHAPIIVDVDPHRIEQVISSLLDNADEIFCWHGTICGHHLHRRPYAFVKVNDRGVGIPAEKLPHIFDQWYQAHFTTQGDYGGMGLDCTSRKRSSSSTAGTCGQNPQRMAAPLSGLPCRCYHQPNPTPSTCVRQSSHAILRA